MCVSVTIKSILYNLHTVFLSLYRYSTYPSIHSLLSKGEFSFCVYFSFLLYFFHSLLIFWTVHLLLYLPHRSVSVTCCSFCAPHLEFVYSFVPFLQSGLASHPFFNFSIFIIYFFVVASPALVVGMQDNVYTVVLF